ncbi:MAG: bifunctional aspartate kinase/diaminopimelate decarboxylase [Gammaproteobacteria bacterium]|nr:bifunctional aspartate kinase/diaminopimelate decarboxylase [Gammaproteobacteria bacterium]
MNTINQDTFPPRAVDAAKGDQADEASRWLVMKFGGTSVAAAERWTTIRDLIRERQAAGYRPVIVHSALATVSNRLLAALTAAVEGEFQNDFEGIVSVHVALATELGLDGQELLGGFFADLEQLLAGIRLIREISPRVHVKVMALGELMATTLGAAYLNSQGIPCRWTDARDVLQSIDVPQERERARYLSASCLSDADPDLQSNFAATDEVILTQGFIARNSDGEAVLLGRGGSDTSAAYFAAKLVAAGLEIWTDVPGMFSANPRVVSGARLLKSLSYEEAQEIASTGGSVLHPRCIRPVRTHGIPLRIRCTSQPTLDGTLISHDPGSDAPAVKAISSRDRITVVSMETVGMWREVGFLAEAFRCFSDLGLSIDLVTTAESNVTVTLDTGLDTIDETTLTRLQALLGRMCRVEIIRQAEVVSLVGQKIRAMLHEIGPALEVFSEHRIHLVSQAANDLNLSFVVEEGQAHRLTKQLHSTLVRPAKADALFGPTWDELTGPQKAPVSVVVEPWWQTKRQQLLEIGEQAGAAYVYDLDSVRGACDRLKSMDNFDQVFFAIKANSHLDILRTVEATGVNFECVSPGEIDRVFGLFPDLDPHRILFTPNFAPRNEYEYALERGVWVTLDNLHPLQEWGEIFAGHEVFLRLDTGQGRGHHEHVRTAGVHSKFGIPLFELDEVKSLAAAHNVQIVGLHAHTGSGILQADNWLDVATHLVEVAQGFQDVRMLDLGGGLGVPEKAGQDVLDMTALNESVAGLKTAHPQYQLWLEPGRYVVAQAGVLLTAVTQLKGKGDVQYVGVSTGMNSLIRPALYGAYHEIANLTRLDQASDQVVNVVGPICETGDKLGTDRLLPACREGDILLIGNAGAYGYVMSSNYNLRDPAQEFTLEI